MSAMWHNPRPGRDAAIACCSHSRRQPRGASEAGYSPTVRAQRAKLKSCKDDRY